MPALPWTAFSPPDPDREYRVMASRLPLARYRDMPGFLSATMAIRAQLARTSGLVGYALDAHLARKTFYTVSAWMPSAVRTRTEAASASSVLGCGPPRSRSGAFPAPTCPSAGPRYGAGSPALKSLGRASRGLGAGRPADRLRICARPPVGRLYLQVFSYGDKPRRHGEDRARRREVRGGQGIRGSLGGAGPGGQRRRGGPAR